MGSEMCIRDRDGAFERLEQWQIAAVASKGRLKSVVDGTGPLTRAYWLDTGGTKREAAAFSKGAAPECPGRLLETDPL